MNTNLDMEIEMKTLLKSIALTTLIFSFAVSASAQQRFNNSTRPKANCIDQIQQFRGNQGSQHQRMLQYLDLSDEQNEQIQSIHLNGQKAMLPLRNQMREKNARLLSLTTGDEFDEAAVNTLITEISDLNASMMTMRISHRQQIRSLLTEEQQVKFDSFHMNMKNRSGRMGRGQ
ncbi:Spy/CpxP family protein refolding chaperone [Gracilimonas sp.]|uniref:Spy/CpxP family protein refolding chaperone n=1 Tax=Gracilimonas sp. TaxID=1974203 RepID=UPI0032EC4F9C